MMSSRRRGSVCRSLFGPVDHDQLRQDLELKLQEISEQDSQRWNFSFQAETPLSGRFEWEVMSAEWGAVCTLHLCSKTQRGETGDKQERLTGTDQENCSGISNAPRCPAEGNPIQMKRSKHVAEPRTNAPITDFFTKRRRSTETRSTTKSFHSRSSEAAQCRTLR